MDSNTTFQAIKNRIEQMVSEREWQQFHSLKNLSMDISIEAAELMEHFLWSDEKSSFEQFDQKKR